MTARRLLMIEDNPGDVLLLRMALEDIGLAADLAVCRDGESAISQIEATAAPDSVLLDLNVPCRDGLEVLQVLRATPGWEAVPVMVFTGAISRRDGEQVAELGAEYVQKPHGYAGFLEIAAGISAKLDRRSAQVGAAGAAESATRRADDGGLPTHVSR